MSFQLSSFNRQISVNSALLYPVFLCVTFSLSGCYLQGSSCSGPLCISVATEIGNQGCTFNCEPQIFCPDAGSVRINSRNALNQLRQSVSSDFCAVNSNQTTGSVSSANVIGSNVVFNETLFTAADRQARDMASNNFVGQTGSDGLGINDRVAALDNSISNVSQLVAGGFTNSRALIDEWLRQPDECRKLLEPDVTEFAMACRFDSNTDFGTYWSLVLATE